jgi:hypothetical protein
MKDLEKYLGPYIPFGNSDNGEGGVARYSLHKYQYHPIYYTYNRKLGCCWGYGSNYYERKEVAMAKADKSLIHRGYILLTQEQFERYSVLL